MLSRIAESPVLAVTVIERAEYTARLLDVNFHMLAPSNPGPGTGCAGTR